MRRTIRLRWLVMGCWGTFLVLMPLAVLNRTSTVFGWVCALGILVAVLLSYMLVLSGRVKD